MAQKWSGWYWRFGLVSSLAISGAIVAFPTSALAEIVPFVGSTASGLNFFDVTGLIAQDCSAGAGNAGRGESEFIITGRGGLPFTPREALASEPALADLGTPIQGKGDRALAIPSTNFNTETAPTQLVETQGWMIDANGEVVLTARPSTVTPHNPWLTAANCHLPQTSF